MNKIVLEHYPVSSLPDDVKRVVGDVSSVRLTIESDSLMRAAPTPVSGEALIAQLREEGRSRKGMGVSPEEAVARIRELRDEWED